ncbi:hypothetical protein [Candidatus Methylobacter favarea]|nr:hypothetical protein [Candidatus Methylobacter favarea]
MKTFAPLVPAQSGGLEKPRMNKKGLFPSQGQVKSIKINAPPVWIINFKKGRNFKSKILV